MTDRSGFYAYSLRKGVLPAVSPEKMDAIFSVWRGGHDFPPPPPAIPRAARLTTKTRLGLRTKPCRPSWER